ncbi:hypothetical protein ACQP04_12970 [Pseudonocardia halophobica]|uniref:hypothetical protein n=1 Tax=Pseudonocardia halophobica TaxID=29401 RepID=UPI003D8E04EB
MNRQLRTTTRVAPGLLVDVVVRAPFILQAVADDPDDYYGGDYLQDIVEQRLVELGGQRLRLAAHDEAARYVDERYPWDGQGDEPVDRVSAYIAVLWQFGDAAATR